MHNCRVDVALSIVDSSVMTIVFRWTRKTHDDAINIRDALYTVYNMPGVHDVFYWDFSFLPSRGTHDIWRVYCCRFNLFTSDFRHVPLRPKAFERATFTCVIHRLL